MTGVAAEAVAPAEAGVAAYRALTRRRRLVVAGLGATLLACLVADLMIGPARYGVAEVVGALASPASAPAALRVVIWEIRLPVALMAMVTGAALAIAGAQMQTILDNPLASPFTLGISAAASFGAALALVLGVSIVPVAIDYLVPANAFVAAAGAALLIHALSQRRGVTTETVVLVFTFNALLSLLQFVASEQALGAVVFWTMGSLTKATWHKLAITSAVLALCVPAFARRAWALTALRLGDDKARSFGINVRRLRLETMLLVSLLAAVPVAFVGTIGFIGLVGPHLARMLVGEDQRFFMPASALAGAALLSAASVVSKALVPGLIVPISIVTALVGVPFFFSLILSRDPRWRSW